MKHTSRFMLFASLIAAFGMLCCSEDNDTTEDNDISNCTDGTWKCDGNTLSKCISGKWETIHICDENTLCNIATGTCAPNDTSNCTDGTWKCDGNTLSKCASGKWEVSQTCKENTQCNSKTGTCEANDVSECTDGSWKCDGDILSKCASGKWEWVQACAPYEQCNAETGTCDIFVVPDCAEDEHIWDNTCEKNSIENCIWHGTQCKTGKNAKSTCDSEYGCMFECNDGYGQYVTGITVIDSYISTAGKHVSFVNHTLSDECVPAFQSKWRRQHNNNYNEFYDYSIIIPIAFPKDKSESITIDWGDGRFTHITSETEIDSYEYYANSYEHMEDCLKPSYTTGYKRCSYTYFGKKNNNNTYAVHYYLRNTEADYDTVRIVGTSNWSCPVENSYLSDAVCNNRDLISIQSYGNITFGERAFLSADNLESLPAESPRLSNNITGFFQGARKFNQDISSWDTSNVTDMSYMFYNANTFNQPLNNWDTSNVTSMSGMFMNANTFNQPLNNWNTSNVIDMSGMFNGAIAFNQPLNNWDTSNVTKMGGVGIFGFGMFQAATSFNQPLNNWNTSKVTNIRNMFKEASAFNQPLDQWDVSNVLLDPSNTYSGDGVFRDSGLQKDNYCKLFAGPYSSNWNLIDLGLTYDCEDTCQNGNCNNTCNDNECFYNNSCINQDNHCGKQCLNCNTFTSHATAGTCNNNGTCQVTACEAGYHIYNNACEADSTISCNDNECFYNNSCINQNDHCGKQCLNCNTFTPHATAGTCNNNGSCQVTACEAGYHIYNNACEADSTQTMISVWEGNSVSFPIQGRVGTIIIDWGDGKSDTITSGESIYIRHNYSKQGTYTISVSGTINNWSCDDGTGTSLCSGLISIQSYGHTTFGENAFFKAENLVSLPTNITPQFYTNKMVGTFQGATNFNQDISFWDTSNVTSMNNMFYGATTFNQPLNTWDTSKVTSMNNMFRRTTAFNQPLDNWNTSRVTDMKLMFYEATAFNQPLNTWDTSKVTDMHDMFTRATAFNQPLNDWDTSNVTIIRFMFSGATAFNQPLDKWDISNVTDMTCIFGSSGLDKSNYCALFSGAYRRYWTNWKSSLCKSYNCN